MAKMIMHNPPHPGEIIKEAYLEPLGLTVTEAAKALKVTDKTLSAIINGTAGIISNPDNQWTCHSEPKTKNL